MGDADVTSINTNHLACTWKVEMKKRDSIKEEGGNETRGLRKTHRKHCSIKNWCYTESVGWTLRLRWTTSGCGRPTKWTCKQKGDRSGPAKHPPMAKLVSQEWSSNFFGSQASKKCTYPCFVQTGPLYRDLGVVICPVTSPRFTKANESGHNFLNGYRSCNR